MVHNNRPLAFGEVLIFAGPFGAWTEFAANSVSLVKGKVEIDASNPYHERDGSIAQLALLHVNRCAGYVADLVPESKYAKSFNSLYWTILRDQARRTGVKLAMPIVAENDDAIAMTSYLAKEAGFDPVLVSGLINSSAIEPGSPIYAKSLTADQIVKILGLKI